jgi:membrane-associated phospholipid phosphatase
VINYVFRPFGKDSDKNEVAIGRVGAEHIDEALLRCSKLCHKRGRTLRARQIKDVVTLIHAVTNLADLTTILPFVSGVLAVLLASHEWRAARWWIFAIGVALGAALIAKLGFIPCGRMVAWLHITSPSGHTASATAAYGGLAMLYAQSNGSPHRRAVAVLAACAIALAIGATRIILGAHTVEESILGAAIGLAAPLFLAIPKQLFERPLLRKRAWWLFLPCLVLLALFGRHAGTEGWITLAAMRWAQWLGACAV